MLSRLQGGHKDVGDVVALGRIFEDMSSIEHAGGRSTLRGMTTKGTCPNRCCRCCVECVGAAGAGGGAGWWWWWWWW